MREHESGFADLYDNAKPFQRLMLRGANLRLGESVADKAATGAACRIQHFHQRLAQDEDVGGRAHGHLSVRPRPQRQAVHGLVGRGFKILNSTPPTAVIVFKATVDRSTVLCSASIVIPATDTSRLPDHRHVSRHRRRRPQSGPKGGPGHLR